MIQFFKKLKCNLNLQRKPLNRMSLRNSKYKQNYAREISLEPPKKNKNTSNTPQNKENKQKNIDHTNPTCCICYQSSDKITFINCKKGGVQFKNYGRGSTSCKDKPICLECRQKCIKSCPFCRNHKLNIIETPRYPKKKRPWAFREIEMMDKLRQKKNKKKIEIHKLKRWDSEYERTMLWQRIYTRTQSISTSEHQIRGEENIFGRFYSNYDFRLIF